MASKMDEEGFILTQFRTCIVCESGVLCLLGDPGPSYCSTHTQEEVAPKLKEWADREAVEALLGMPEGYE